MDKNIICEAMYALPGNVVVRRRKSLLASILVFIAGVAVIVLNNLLGDAISVDLRSGAVFVGGTLAVVGAIMLLARVAGSTGVPFHTKAHCYLRYDEIFFDRNVLNEVLQTVGEGKVSPLLGMERAQVPAVTVAMYRTPDNRFAAMQVFEYIDLEYRPLSELKIVGA